MPVVICAGANGFEISRLFGTPLELHSSPGTLVA